MTINGREIFRDKAIKAYSQEKNKVVLLRLISPPVFLSLWLLLALLLCVCIFAWTTSIPTYIVGTGIVQSAGHANKLSTVLVLLVPQEQANVRVGQKAQIWLGTAISGREGCVMSIEHRPLSPAAIRARFPLLDHAVPITQPATVALIQVKLTDAELYQGSRAQVHIQTGSQRLLAFLPLAGQLIH